MKALRFLDRHAEEIIVVTALAVMSVVIGVQVFMRYVMQSSLSWSEELARYVFILLVYVGISYGVKRRKHICVEVFTMWLPRRGQIVVEIIADLIFMVFAIVIIRYGYLTASKIFSLGQRSPALGLQMGVVYMALPFSYLLTLVRLIQNIVWKIQVLSGKEEEEKSS